MSEGLYSASWYRVADLKPRLRSHCRIHRHQYRGELWYVLQNPMTGRFHRFSPNVYLLIGLMDGSRTIQEIWDYAAEKLGDDLPTQQQIIQLLTQLFRTDVLQTDVMPVIEEMQSREQKMQRQKKMQHLRSPLSIRLPLFDPDRMLSAMLPWVRPFANRAAFIVWLMVLVSAIFLAVQHWQPLTENVVDRALAMENLLLLWFVFPVVKALHELGHGLAVKLWGGEVHETGLMFLVFMPVPYVDASASSGFREKRQRIVVAAAGLMVELFLAALALFVWINAEPGMVRAVAFNVMLIAGVSALVFNGNPLLRFDSYYILSDLIEIPNFGARANQYIGYLLQRYLFKVPSIQSPVMATGEEGWFFFYAIASFCYRMVMMFSIALMVADHYFILGTVLAAWAFYSMLLQPLYKSLKTLFTGPQITPVRTRAITITAAGVAFVCIVFLLVPVPASVRVEGVIWAPEGTLVRPEVDGTFVKTVVAPGSYVETGDVLIEMTDLQLIADVEIFSAQLKELQTRYDQEIIRDRAQAQITREEIVSINGLLQRAIERKSALQVLSPKAGIFTVEQAADMPGRFARRGEVLAYVLAFDDATARVVVNQDQADLVRRASRQVEVRFAGSFDEVVQGQLQREVPAATNEIPSAVLTTDGGGAHATLPAEEGKLTAAQRLFQFDVVLNVTRPVQQLGERVYIKFIREPEPLAVQGYRVLRQLFLTRFNV
ncbi:MAG: hypothetical protein KUG53_02550 [Pseudomonadales bacterium]|nr:hypothetical protein [Pseudomonadales bacterium]